MKLKNKILYNMLHERINLKDLEKFESIKLRLKKENIGIELSIIDDELLIDVTPSYQKPTKAHICEKEKFKHIMEECDKFDKKHIFEQCKKYDEKCYDSIIPKKYIEDLIEKVEEKDVDDDTELSIKLVRDYLKKNKIPREKLCSIFQDIWLDDPVKKWCEEQKEKEEHPFEELLKVTSNKNKSSMDFEDINQYIKNNDELIEKDLNPKKDYDFTNIFKNLKK
jgi:hypothetical protein